MFRIIMTATALVCLMASPAFATGDPQLDGLVYCDANQNGEFDAGDIPLEGADVVVTDAGGNIVGTATTDAQGLFWILGLPTGSLEASVDPNTVPRDSIISPDPFAFAPGEEVEFYVEFGIDSASCRTAGACWMTGGGVKFSSISGERMAEHGPRDSLGGNVFPSCSSEPGDGGNWNHISHSQKLHFQGRTVETVSCGNVPGIEPGSESPVTPFNYIEFMGTGTIRGIKGNSFPLTPVTFFARVEDRNEPGSNGAKAGVDVDRYYLHVVDTGGNTLLLIDMDGDAMTVDPITITGGNLQLRISSRDDPPVLF